MSQLANHSKSSLINYTTAKCKEQHYVTNRLQLNHDKPTDSKQPTVTISQCTYIATHPLNSPLSRTTQMSWYQKGKTNLDFTGARDSEWQ